MLTSSPSPHQQTFLPYMEDSSECQSGQGVHSGAFLLLESQENSLSMENHLSYLLGVSNKVSLFNAT